MRRCSQRMSRCGCVHLTKPENRTRGSHERFHASRRNRASCHDGNQTAILCSTRPGFFRRVGATGSLSVLKKAHNGDRNEEAREVKKEGYHHDGKKSAFLCSIGPGLFRRVSAARSLLSACRAYLRPFICARVGAGDLRRWWPSFH